MADIDVKPKRNGVVPWIVALLVLALVTWAVVQIMDDDADTDTVVMSEPYTPIVEVPAAGTQQPVPQPGDISTILANPAQYVGQRMPSMQVQVGDVPTDRGFWVQDDSGDKLFAILIDKPAEKPIDINSGQTLQIDGGTLRDQQYLGQVPNTMDDNTRSIAQAQQIYLVVDESNLNIAQSN